MTSGFAARSALASALTIVDAAAINLGMTVPLPSHLEGRLSPESAALHLAIGLFVSDEATLGQAAEVAGLSQSSFLRELGKRRIPIHYGPEELAEDLQVVEELAQR